MKDPEQLKLGVCPKCGVAAIPMLPELEVNGKRKCRACRKYIPKKEIKKIF